MSPRASVLAARPHLAILRNLQSQRNHLWDRAAIQYNTIQRALLDTVTVPRAFFEQGLLVYERISERITEQRPEQTRALAEVKVSMDYGGEGVMLMSLTPAMLRGYGVYTFDDPGRRAR